ncbi:monovalent cation/H(+) antiporter subunit G [Halanaerobacter jeridensis]|uniref:Multicomponent Na+:H+ antiporter subunit G n=1 Tax=Halanaerobacter jeridensis TaxID=706427 RepID=A0A938XUN7_9FIRM|nr:monovalent cation/H(+) antiporter subunit G [Halanaerobacter jeridensis]MBM7556646.1 multicomponent Na+:H+ antiporter subunit G [Halanaerobacter jeridensis]
MAYFLIINGTFFFLITGIGMIRFTDFYIRLHILSKAVTGGAISILLGIIFLTGFSFFSLKLLVIILLLIITNPATSHAIAWAAYYSDEKDHFQHLKLSRDDLQYRKTGDE